MRTERILLLLTALAALALGWRLLPGRATWSADEGDLVRLACAMATDARAWLRPDYHPAPGAFLRLGDGLVAPPLASALIALPALLGWASPGAWPLIPASLLLVSIAALARALRPASSPWLALAAATLVAPLAPRFAIDLLTLEAEIPLAAFSCLALALVLRPRDALACPAAAGALVGLAFLAKLWLAGPVVLAVAGALLASRPRPRLLLAFALAALATGAAHLLLVALLDPTSLERWLREVYLAPFLASGGIASTKWQGVSSHPEWSHGFWYYPPAIARELGLALPLALLGAYRSVRGPEARPLHGALLGMTLGVAVLSVPAIKEPLYVLPAIALGAALAARGLVDLATSPGLRGRRVAVLAAAVALAVAPLHRRPSGPAGAVTSCKAVLEGPVARVPE
ncbi:MAG: hypothetical protein MUF64_03555 [Polyangiaceae bacterium]|jgi:4-amino-4-deoxy-L-arabinose transferase-like glycosyltransferase|nr:hypothetical protein [Polyangiaceae bacterium]